MAYAVAPALLGVAVFSRAVNTVAEVFDIPAWAKTLIFLTLCPALVVSIFRWSLPQKRRARLAILIVIMATLCGLLVAARHHESALTSVLRTTVCRIREFCIPIVEVDPTTTAWFWNSGEPRLFFTNPTTNTWRFYRAFPGAHDPKTGVLLQPVAVAVSQQWGEQTKMAEQKEAAEQASQKKIQQLQIATDSLRKERENRIHHEQELLNSLVRTLESKRSGLTAVENEIMSDLALQSAHEASLQLDDAGRTLADAVKASENGSPSNLAILQNTVRTAIEKADMAEKQINVGRANREKAKQDVKAEAERVASTKEISKSAPESRGKPQPHAIAIPSVAPNTAVVTVRIQNGTQERVCVTFSSPDFHHVWPSSGNAWIAEPGESIAIQLQGLRGEPIFLDAWNSRDPSIRWH